MADKEDPFCTEIERKNLIDFYEKIWKPYRLNLIKNLEKLANEIQQCEDVQRKGQIAYSSTGIVSALATIGGIMAAPFTAGVSLGLTATGFGLAAAAGGASAIHSTIANRDIMKRKSASEICEMDNKLTEKLKDYIGILINKIDNINTFVEILKEVGSTCKDFGKSGYKIYAGVQTTRAFKAIKANNLDKAAKILDMSKYVQKVLPNCLINAKILTVGENGVVKFASATGRLGRGAAAPGNVSRGFVRLAGKVALPLTVIAMVFDIKSLVENAKKVSAGELSEHAQRLQKAAKDLKTQMEEYDTEIKKLLTVSQDY